MAAVVSSEAALVLLLVIGFVAPSTASVFFSSLHQTLVVTASPTTGQVLNAGVDQIKVSWSLNESLAAGTDSAYKKVKLVLCYAPVSQTDRRWRKTYDELKKDKTCQFKIASVAYGGGDAVGSYEYTVERDIPTATYFVRAYALDADGTQVAYGQTTDAKKTTNLFEVAGISGRHASLDIAAACFSAFSVAALFFFFYVGKRKQT
ncbi:high-affinity nitrate transporter-activating protein 2.1-like [Zingiber officinale]|uniref:High-affinity nitrate transporter n=1 Tax=Zingiber officinale TaxID=94328 RepID=A0A8J5HQQ5_ZINOF|nr:high-affinity nitrate transporter-activating protein 2.1-like [Zingiber officinale]KAG6529320.1 hypothetical protein ZIOFF_011517 [Zingiber officinale]